MVHENKKRHISVANFRDRIVRRYVYDKLVRIWNDRFFFDAWSNLTDKGVVRAIQRTQELLRAYPQAYVWRADIKQFFDSVDHGVLLKSIQRRVTDPDFLWIINRIIQSYNNASFKERVKRRSQKACQLVT